MPIATRLFSPLHRRSVVSGWRLPFDTVACLCLIRPIALVNEAAHWPLADTGLVRPITKCYQGPPHTRAANGSANSLFAFVLLSLCCVCFQPPVAPSFLSRGSLPILYSTTSITFINRYFVPTILHCDLCSSEWLRSCRSTELRISTKYSSYEIIVRTLVARGKICLFKGKKDAAATTIHGKPYTTTTAQTVALAMSWSPS